MYIKLKSLLLVLSLAILALACVNRNAKDYIPQVENEIECKANRTDSISFQKDVLPLLTTQCATSGCHSGRFPQAGLNLEASVAYAQLTRRSRGYIDTINPRASILYNSLTAPENLMPPSGKLPDCEINTIMKWMGEKAKNN